MHDINKQFEEAYIPRVRAFTREISEIKTSGIPEPHLPHWGIDYERCPLRIGIIGRDTRYWGDMPNFTDAVNENPQQALYLGKESFDSFEFTKWTNNFGTTFWDTALKILAAMHGIDDWKQLKRKNIIAPLKRFLWANANSVEMFEATPKRNNIPWDDWHNVKVASEKYLDSFRLILDTFRPHIIFLMNWEPNEPFLDFALDWTEFGDHQAVARDPVTKCLILATAHPTWLNQKGLYDAAIGGLIQRAKSEIASHSHAYDSTE